MSLRVLICPDKFKGTLSAQGAAEAMARGWKRARPTDKLELLPMSDGGDGFGEIIGNLIDAEPRKVETLNPAHQPITAKWWWKPATRTAIIESATSIGVAVLPPHKFHPFELDTFGLGKVLIAAAEHGARTCIVGVGGSATNDGGFGLAQSLGWEFFDAAGNEIHCWTKLHDVTQIRPPKKRLPFREITVALDVQNKLLGRRGCSRVYGPQKGLLAADFAKAEACLAKLARASAKLLHHNYAADAGSGAAGGLGFGLMAFAGAKPQSGFKIFSSYACLEQRVRSADVVLTGEGAIDRQTLMGKGVGQLVMLCRKRRVPCLGLAGTILNERQASHFFTAARGLTKITDEQNAKSRPSEFLNKLAFEFAKTVPAVKRRGP